MDSKMGNIEYVVDSYLRSVYWEGEIRGLSVQGVGVKE